MTKRKTNVFIADDHPAIRLGLISMLKANRAFQVVGQAANSDELFETLSQADVDLLILDLNMPGQDYERNVQTLLQEFPYLKVLVYTGYEHPDLAKSLLEKGIHGYVIKQASPEIFFEAIEVILNGQQFVYPAYHPGLPTASSQQHGANQKLRDDFRKRLGLSKREQEILVLISKGLTSQGIGDELFISKYTVETHRKNILRKLEVNSSTELVKFAIQQGLLS